MPFGDDAPRGPWDIAGIHGAPARARWDAVVTVEAPGLEGERALFVALPDGRLVVEEGPSASSRSPRAVDAELARPYRAEAVRRERGLWAVAANAIEVVELPGIAGEEIELDLAGRRPRCSRSTASAPSARSPRSSDPSTSCARAGSTATSGSSRSHPL